MVYRFLPPDPCGEGVRPCQSSSTLFAESHPTRWNSGYHPTVYLVGKLRKGLCPPSGCRGRCLSRNLPVETPDVCSDPVFLSLWIPRPALRKRIYGAKPRLSLWWTVLPGPTPLSPSVEGWSCNLSRRYFHPQLAHDTVYAGTLHTHAGTYRVYAVVVRFHSYFSLSLQVCAPLSLSL